MNNTDYLTAFFEKKDLPVEMFKIRHEGQTHLISSTYVIESIVEFALPDQQQNVVDVLQQIDYYSMPIMPFLRHLAEALVVAGVTQRVTGTSTAAGSKG